MRPTWTKPWHGLLWTLVALLSLAGCDGATAPDRERVPVTREEAMQRFDQAIVQLGWAQQDLWRMGGRDIVVFVQIDSSLPPYYFRLPRKPAAP